MKKTFIHSRHLLIFLLALGLGAGARAQVNSGSNGSDGAFNPTTSTNINMADHPNGIYQYTSVNIPSGVVVTFIPNANNSPVTWLVQSNVVINGTVNLSGKDGAYLTSGGDGGPGGWPGGSSSGQIGQGPGGGVSGPTDVYRNGSYNYGNIFLIPLLGGSGGSGGGGYSGGGGGGAILIAAFNSIKINGSILSHGGGGYGFGSGGAIRLVTAQISGNGIVRLDANAGSLGRIRFDTYDNQFVGTLYGQFTQGSQFIIIPTAGQLPQLNITSVAGVSVSASPTGTLSTPDAVVSAQQSNPIPIVVSCANLPLHSLITVSVKPASGVAVSAVGYNDTGTLAASTVTVSLVIPRGGGLIYATAATGN